jgi:hypothetical protein
MGKMLHEINILVLLLNNLFHLDFCCCYKMPEINKRKRDLFEFMVSEVSAHGWLAPLFWGLWHGRMSWWVGVW